MYKYRYYCLYTDILMIWQFDFKKAKEKKELLKYY